MVPNNGPNNVAKQDLNIQPSATQFEEDLANKEKRRNITSPGEPNTSSQYLPIN
jgi:hypothetical protein